MEEIYLDVVDNATLSFDFIACCMVACTCSTRHRSGEFSHDFRVCAITAGCNTLSSNHLACFSATIASIGLGTNNAVMIVASMLLSPLMVSSSSTRNAHVMRWTHHVLVCMHSLCAGSHRWFDVWYRGSRLEACKDKRSQRGNR